MSMSAASDSSESAAMLQEYLVRAQAEKLKALEHVKAEVSKEYESRIATMEAQIKQLTSQAGLSAAAPAPSAGGKNIEAYRSEMADLVLSAQQSRLNSMDALRKELDSAFNAQAASVKDEIAALKPQAVNGAAAVPAHTATVPVPSVHAAYAARLTRKGWEDRWGDDEVARVSGDGATALQASAAPAAALAAPAAAAAAVHPAYLARTQRAGWEDRWGSSEVQRTSGTSAAAAPAAAAAAQTAQHPAYAARLQRQGWQDRWGASEAERIAGADGAAAAAAPADQHPAYAARMSRPGWADRWGREEVVRIETVASDGAVPDLLSPSTAARAAASESVAAAALRAEVEELRAYLAEYAARVGTERARLTARAETAAFRAEELAADLAEVRGAYSDYMARALEARMTFSDSARMAALSEALQAAGGAPAAAAAAPAAAATPAAAAAAVAPAQVHPAYAARLQRPGLDARWGAEEVQRVTSAVA